MKSGIVSAPSNSDKSPCCQGPRAAASCVPESVASSTWKALHMGFLDGKRFLVTGVLSNRSIAYGIARACRREGAELAFSYQGERFKDRVSGFAAEFGSSLVFDCDVADDAQIAALFSSLIATWPTFHGLKFICEWCSSV